MATSKISILDSLTSSENTDTRVDQNSISNKINYEKDSCKPVCDIESKQNQRSNFLLEFDNCENLPPINNRKESFWPNVYDTSNNIHHFLTNRCFGRINLEKEKV